MFTTDNAKKMMQGVLRDAPNKFYSSIYTVIRDGIEDVTRDELPAVVAVIATEVRVEAALAALVGQVGTLKGRLDALARRHLAFEAMVKSASPPPSESGAENENETEIGSEALPANGSGSGSAGADAAYGGPPADPEEAQVRALFETVTPSGQSASASASVGAGSNDSGAQGPRATVTPRGGGAATKAPLKKGAVSKGETPAPTTAAQAAPPAVDPAKG